LTGAGRFNAVWSRIKLFCRLRRRNFIMNAGLIY
jgi:hypothetical protein